jgi:hypothetical protein
MKTLKTFLAFCVFAMVSTVFPVETHAQALSEQIELYEFKIDQGDNGLQYLYLDSEKKYSWPGFCAGGANASLCGPNSGPDYNGTELALIDYLGSDPTHQYYVPYIRTGKVWNVFRVGTPGTVPVHRIWVHEWQAHVYVSETETFLGDNVLSIMREMPETYQDDGASYAVKEVLPAFEEGLLPISQACGIEKQTGLSVMLRSYNGNEAGNHQLTTRTDGEYFEDMKNVAGWSNATRDVDTSAREAGIWCVPAISKKLVQSTTYSGAPGDCENGVCLQLQTHNLSEFTLGAGNLISLPSDYIPTWYFSTDLWDKSWTGRFDVNPNRGVIALTRGMGGYNEFGSDENQPLKVLLPKSDLPVEEGWASVKIDEESGVVYGVSVTDTIRYHAYDPKGNRYLWNYTVPEQYREYNPAEGELYLAGEYLVGYFWTWVDKTNFQTGIIIFGNLESEEPEVRIIDLPGPRETVTDFTFDAKAMVGYFANAAGKELYRLDFRTWSMTTEPLPFQPYALLADPYTDELYATEVPRTYEMGYPVVDGNLWKRNLTQGTWDFVAPQGYGAKELFITTLGGKQFVTIFNTHCFIRCPIIDFVDQKTGLKLPSFANELFGSLYWQNGLGIVNDRQ